MHLIAWNVACLERLESEMTSSFYILLDLAKSILETETEEVVTVKAISSLLPDE